MNARCAAAAMLIALAGCNSPKVTEPENEATEDATLNTVPVAPGAFGNESVNYGEGPVTPGEQANVSAAEQTTPDEVAAAFAKLLDQRKFADAFALVDADAMDMDEKAFESRFAGYRTIDAAVGKVGPTEGAAGSLYSDVQLTLSGNKKDGSPYVMTGPVTLRRVNDVPGSTAEQRRWRIVKMKLTADPKAAEKLVKH